MGVHYNDETISQHPTVTSFRDCSQAQPQCYKVIGGSQKQSSSIQSWNNHIDNDFPEERGCRYSSVPVLDSVCVPSNPISKTMSSKMQHSTTKTMKTKNYTKKVK